LLAPVVGMALGVIATLLLDVDQSISNLIINLGFLTAVILLITHFKPSRAELGVQPIPAQMRQHIIISLLVLSLYLLFYIFAIRISALKPWETAVQWGLFTNLIVIIAEELYFRGILYGFVQKRYSARTALVVSSLLFGLFHARQGLSGIIAKLFTGWLWGSVRYASGMIFLIIFPIHYAFNTVWLLFVGNWNNPPIWAIYALPIVEFLLGLIFVIIHDRQTKKV
ncbi:MAG: CPBP family intramembrane metalloprotease, partial [Chloroflexi bacterium]|nr:CPBP family intramembrane metalloprotease [Chloroflexota bacterium]